MLNGAKSGPKMSAVCETYAKVKLVVVIQGLLGLLTIQRVEKGRKTFDVILAQS